MSTTTKQTFTLEFDEMEPGCVPGDRAEFAQFMRRHSRVVKDGPAGSFTVGPEPPKGPDNQQDNIHFLTDADGCVVGVGAYCKGKYRFHRFGTRGEGRYFYAGSAPAGWSPADGSNGGISIPSGSSGVYDPLGDGSWVLHVFTGL